MRDGFTYGFVIPFEFSPFLVFSTNLHSARDNPEVFHSKIQTEVNLGRIEGPFAEVPFDNLRVSPLGVVPKKDPGKFRLIHHLSYLRGSSVDDGISKDSASVSYVSFDREVDPVALGWQRHFTCEIRH